MSSALDTTTELVQAALPPGSVLVEWVRYRHYLGKNQWESRYGATVVPPTGMPKWVCLGPTELIENNIARYQQLLRSQKAEPTLATELAALYRQLWYPLETVLPAATTSIILSPDAGLNYISFATLLNTEGEFLAEKYLLRYVDSGRDLLRTNAPSMATNMVMFANPDYTVHRDASTPP